ncbi:LysR substrate-binding domain-containing protein, partial [Streptomyces scabiei]|uniref:LysR substrate-binding domain-containing protein n=1 Tax=Streptomyces scabiei TaxID=1930 RepID=UPI0029903707
GGATATATAGATAGAALVAPAVARLRAEHPGVRIELRLIDPDHPLPAVQEGGADLALVVRPRGAAPGGVRLLHLLDDTYFAVLPAAHPLAGRADLALSDLADEPWVGSQWPGPCPDAQPEACAEAGFRPRFAVESEHCTTAWGFVAAGPGVGLVPGLGLGNPHPDVVVRRLTGPEPRRSLHVAVRETAPPQPALTTFVRALREAADASPARRGTRRRRYALAWAGSLSPASTATWRGSAYGSDPYQTRATV